MIVDGVILINKPKGITSHDVVSRIRRLYGTRKVGHTGTLDPMATGVMAVLIGRGTKAADFLLAEDKGYIAGLTLGKTTDTLDITGQVLFSCDAIPCEEQVQKCIEEFRGRIKQTPPMYSALKVDGQKLCDLARKGIEVERQSREVEIFSLEAQRVCDREYILRVSCSKGTYIRTLCDDIGKALGCGGVMNSLERTKSGNFVLEQCHTLEEIEELSSEERWALVQPTEQLFAHLPRVKLPEFYARLASSGNEIYQKKIKTKYNTGEYIGLYRENGVFFAVGQVREYEEGSAIKPVKQFLL